MKKLLKGNLSVSESSKPLNNPLVSTKNAYEIGLRDISIFLKNSDGQKETKDWQTVKTFECTR